MILKETVVQARMIGLHMDRSDSRRPLAEALLTHIDETGSLIAYNIPFERSVLRHLVAQFPEYTSRLNGMDDCLWDQLPIFRKHYRDYRFGKSNSLKSVLLAIAPSLSYNLLDVQSGTQAQVVWEEMVGGLRIGKIRTKQPKNVKHVVKPNLTFSFALRASIIKDVIIQRSDT